MGLKLFDVSGGAAMRRRHHFVRRSLATVLTIVAVVLAPAACAGTDRPPAVVPSAADTVLEHLPRGYSKLLPAMPTATATAPEALAEAERLYATASATGDMRLSTRADALVGRIPESSASSAVLRARAFGAQHRHDFSGAVALLDRAIAAEPRDGSARLARAEVQLVRGNLDKARSDCIALTLGIDARSGILCVASLSLRRGDYASAGRLMDRWLAQTDASDPERRFALVTRGEIASRAGDVDADHWFDDALVLDRDDVRTLAAYARHLRSRDRDADVLVLLANAPDTDALHLQRALAASALHRPGADALAAAQGRRYALAHAVGTAPELRDEAEFELQLRHDPRQALALAQRNFETQRDYEDVDLLQRTAIAAARPDALLPVQQWAATQQLALPTLDGSSSTTTSDANENARRHSLRPTDRHTLDNRMARREMLGGAEPDLSRDASPAGLVEAHRGQSPLPRNAFGVDRPGISPQPFNRVSAR